MVICGEQQEARKSSNVDYISCIGNLAYLQQLERLKIGVTGKKP